MTMTPAERNRLYKIRHPDRVAAARKVYKKEHAEELRAKSRDRERLRRETARAEVIAALGGRCARCGFEDQRALQIDHVNDDGRADKLDRLDGVKYKRKILAQLHTGRFQLLCANCNWIKKAEHEALIRAEKDKQRPPERPKKRAFGNVHFSKVRPERVQRGEDRYNAKLTDVAVRYIRTSSESALSLARKFDVNRELIVRVRARMAWAHVVDHPSRPKAGLSKERDIDAWWVDPARTIKKAV